MEFIFLSLFKFFISSSFLSSSDPILPDKLLSLSDITYGKLPKPKHARITTEKAVTTSSKETPMNGALGLF